MTIDDDNSIYVGGIPYDCTEEDIRRVFDLYGSVIAVKIINARDVGGKCYCFVTFTNPRSAIDAINDMNGRTIGGRIVKVNEVNARGGGRPPPPHFQRSLERDMDWNNRGGRERERGDRYRNNVDRSQDRDMPSRETGYDRPRGDYDQNRDRYLDRDHIRGPEHNEQERTRSHDRGRGKEHTLDRDLSQHTEYDHPHDYDRNRDRSLDRDQLRSRVYHERERSRSRSQDRARSKENNLDLRQDTEADGRFDSDRKDTDKEHLPRSQSG